MSEDEQGKLYDQFRVKLECGHYHIMVAEDPEDIPPAFVCTGIPGGEQTCGLLAEIVSIEKLDVRQVRKHSVPDWAQ